MTVKAQLRWTDGLQFVARAGDSPAVVLDNHEGASGSTPMELFLIGTAGCTAMDVISILKKKRANVADFEVLVSGEQAEEHPRRYTRITIEFVVYGNAVKPADVERAIELSATKYCSAVASLNVEIDHTYRIVDS
jgi:putative redox protein